MIVSHTVQNMGKKHCLGYSFCVPVLFIPKNIKILFMVKSPQHYTQLDFKYISGLWKNRDHHNQTIVSCTASLVLLDQGH